jgi:DNA-directed RNA polymerase subunit M/transcription elongation factor TFIIS
MDGMEPYISSKRRRKVVQKMLHFFPEEYSKRIEQGIYDYTEQYCQSNENYLKMAQYIYKDVFKNLYFNLKNNGRTVQKIVQDIFSRKMDAYNLAFLRPEELDEDRWIKIILRKNTSEEKLNNLPTVEWRPCKVCRSREFFYYQLQTRSADEPMTTFYICKKCNKTYKINL